MLGQLFLYGKQSENKKIIKEIIETIKPRIEKIIRLHKAVGSGAIMNEAVKQIKDKKIAKKVIAIAITGNFKEFDVISEI